jgi:hypothetical protein
VFSAWLDITDHGALLTKSSLSAIAAASRRAYTPPTGEPDKHYGFWIYKMYGTDGSHLARRILTLSLKQTFCLTDRIDHFTTRLFKRSKWDMTEEHDVAGRGHTSPVKSNDRGRKKGSKYNIRSARMRSLVAFL